MREEKRVRTAASDPFPVDPVHPVDQHTLRNVPDMDAILASIEINKPKHATVCGGGFIGLEMAEALRHRNIEVTLVELSPQVMAPVDFEIANVKTVMASARSRQRKETF